MTTKETLTYVAFDGKEFSDMQECIDYEEEVKVIPALNKYGFMFFDEYGDEIKIEPNNRLCEYDKAGYIVMKQELPEEIYKHFYEVSGYYIPKNPGVYRYLDYGWEEVSESYNILIKLMSVFNDKDDSSGSSKAGSIPFTDDEYEYTEHFKEW